MALAVAVLATGALPAVRSVEIARPAESSVPAWDARGTGLAAWQAVACADLSDDGRLAALGTIAPHGDPSVFLLDEAGKVRAQHAVGIRWIHEVAVRPDGTLMALSAISTGQSGDRPKLYTFAGGAQTEEYPDPLLFHYGDHSNHLGPALASAGSVLATLAGNVVRWHGPPGQSSSHFGRDGGALSFAASPGGRAVAGLIADPPAEGTRPVNLVVVDPQERKPLWQRSVVTAVDPPRKMEAGVYGPGAMPCKDSPVYGVLSVTIDAAGRRVAAADYQGWRRLVRGDIDHGCRFMPARPSVRIYGDGGKVLREVGPETFAHPFWCDLAFSPDGETLYVFPHRWPCRGLGGQPFLPADDHARRLYAVEVASGDVTAAVFPDAISDVSVLPGGAVAVACWDGTVTWLTGRFEVARRLAVGKAALLDASADGRLLIATAGGLVRLLDRHGATLWTTDLNRVATPGVKPWTRDQKAATLAPDVWSTNGNRAHSDMGGQYLIKGRDGLLLIDCNAGASFEQNWAKIRSTGHDPKDVRYVLLTHEHGDHAPGAYLWRVATGAKVVAGPETAYILQHTVPHGTGYGCHPPTKVDVVVEADTTMDLAGLPVRVVRLPGHTYGSLGYVVEKAGKMIAFTGDLIMPGGVLGYSGHADFSAEDVLASLRKLKRIGPDLLLAGHGRGDPRDFIDKGIEVGEATGWSRRTPSKPDPFYGLAQRNYLVAAWLQPIVTAAYPDVDGDGRPDIVTYSDTPAGGRIDIYLNRKGTFPEAADASVALPGLRPYGERKLRGCHVNDDGIADFLVSADGSVAVVRSKDGRLAYDVTVLGLGAGWPMQMLAADVNGDGRSDLVTGGRFRKGFQVSCGRPDGSFAPPRTYPTTGTYFDIAVTDLNGDGRSDVTLSSGDLYLADGQGTLPAGPSMRVQTFAGWSFLATGDFDGDGDTDIAILGRPQEEGHVDLNLFGNTGDRTMPFRAGPDRASRVAGASVLRDGPTVADWDGDGTADLVLAAVDRRGAVIVPGSRAGLAAEKAVTVPFDYVAHYDTRLGVADFDGDGRPDIAGFGPTAFQATGVYVWLRKPPR